jgi:hypothetical protein
MCIPFPFLLIYVLIWFTFTAEIVIPTTIVLAVVIAIGYTFILKLKTFPMSETREGMIRLY